MKKLLKIGGIILAGIFIILLIAPSGKEYEKETISDTEEKSIENTDNESKERAENLKEELISEEIEEERIIIAEPDNHSQDYEIIPYETYESDQGEELMLYANLTWNDDYSVDIHGFGYENGQFSERLITEAHLIPVPDTESSYQSEDGTVDMIFADDFISIMTDSVSGADVSFTGDFYLVMDEGDLEISNDIKELSFEDTANFFRDKNNIGKTFKCELHYTNKSHDGTLHYFYLNYEYQNGNSVSFNFQGNVKENDSVFFTHESVFVTGIYLGESNGTINIDILNIELAEE